MRVQGADALIQLTSRLAAGLQGSARNEAVSASAKGKGKKRSNKAIQRCQQQVTTCEPIFNAQCDGDPACIAQRVPCCSLLSTCDFNGFLLCLNG